MSTKLYEMDVLTITNFPNRTYSEGRAALDGAMEQYVALTTERRVDLVGTPRLTVERNSDPNLVNVVVRAVGRVPQSAA